MSTAKYRRSFNTAEKGHKCLAAPTTPPDLQVTGHWPRLVKRHGGELPLTARTDLEAGAMIHLMTRFANPPHPGHLPHQHLLAARTF